MQEDLAIRRTHVSSYLLTVIVTLSFLAVPRHASAGQAWDVTKYDPSANTVLRDTFAFEPSDPTNRRLVPVILIRSGATRSGRTT